ncbi:unnamed protein product, partial [Heterobilharzia americana]
MLDNADNTVNFLFKGDTVTDIIHQHLSKSLTGTFMSTANLSVCERQTGILDLIN